MLGKFILGFNIDAQATEKYYTQHYNLWDIYSELLIIITIMIIIYKLTFHIATLTRYTCLIINLPKRSTYLIFMKILCGYPLYYISIFLKFRLWLKNDINNYSWKTVHIKIHTNNIPCQTKTTLRTISFSQNIWYEYNC